MKSGDRRSPRISSQMAGREGSPVNKEDEMSTREMKGLVAVSLLAVAVGGCATATGAAVGAGAGAAIGAGTGYGAGKGAAIGTGVGAAAGAIYDFTKK